mgnify:CR=1 FL=1
MKQIYHKTPMIKGKEHSRNRHHTEKNKNVYFSFYFEKCTFIDIKLKDLSGALVFGKHGLSLTNPPRPGFSSCLVLPPSDYSFRLGTSNSYKEYLLCDRLAPSVP